MPEGDTIHRAAARLEAALGGQVLARCEIRRDPRGRRPPEPGTILDSVEARGKHLLMHFSDGQVLHTHLHMTGRWDLYRTGQRWRKPAHQARVILETTGGLQAVCFSAPTVELRADSTRDAVTSRAVRSLANLGPDLCLPDVDLDVATARFDRLDPATGIGDALLDQRVAAGVGNVYKSEVCWFERLDPATRLADVDAATRHRLLATAHRLLLANLDSPRRVTHAGGLAVYGRAGRPCPRCRARIRSAKQGDQARTTYWCPTCQPRPSPATPDA